VSLIVVVTAPLTVYALPILAIAGLLGFWELAGQTASAYDLPASEPWSARLRRAGAFIREVLVAGGFLVLTVVTVDAILDTSDLRLPVLVLVLASLACWMTWRMFRLWWSGFAVVLAASFVTALALLSLMLVAGENTPVEGTVAQTLRNLIRLILVFGAAGIVEGSYVRGLRTRRGRDRMVANVCQTVGFVAVLAMIAPRVDAAQAQISEQSWFTSMFFMVILAIATVATLARARFQIRRDCAWYRSWWNGLSVSAVSVPPNIFVAGAMLPSIMLAAIAPWHCWWVAYGLGVAATLLAINRRPRSRPLPPAPVEPLIMASTP
jgi:hypothetical protein